MKKIFAIVLIAVMVITLAACGNSGGGSGSTDQGGSSEPPATAPTKDGGPNANADGSTDLDMVGYYDPGFDYAGGETFKVKYLTGFSGPLYDDNDKGYQHWTKLMGIQYDGMWSSQSDSDLFLQQLQACIDQGYDGLLIDPDTTTYPAILDILNKNPQVQWMCAMSPARDLADADAPLVHPSVMFDNYDCGIEMMKKSIEIAKKKWPDVAIEDIGVVEVDFSVVEAIHDRQRGSYDYWIEETGLEDNYITLDGASGGMDPDTARNLVMPLLSTNTDFKHWLIMASFDDYAPGCAAAVDSLGMSDVSNVVTVGGTSLIVQWDAGGEIPGYETAYYISGTIHTEPVCGALYAYMAGYATPETIWPSWINVNDHGRDTDTYGTLQTPLQWITKDNYQKYLAWADIYTESDEWPYSHDGITRDSFSAVAPIPEYYQVKD